MNRRELKAGTKIDVNGVTYEIINYLNRGGSALVYEVISTDSNRSKKTVLKEFYPQNSHREEDGNEVIPDSGIAKKDFEAWKERFISEGVKSGNAGNITYQVLHIEHVDSEKAVMVMAMTSEDMKPLTELLEDWEEQAPESDDDYNETGRVCYALKIISSLLSGLSAIHNKANLLHGDITPGNLFWAGQNIETGLHCETFFLDFGCAQCFDIYKNVVIPDEDHDFGVTSGYGAPEKYMSEFPMILRPSYDLYAVTALLAVLCFGKQICLHDSWQPVNLYQFKNAEIKNQLKNFSLNIVSKKELERILCKGLSRYPENRYQSAVELQEDIEVLLKLMWPKKFQLACKARDAMSDEECENIWNYYYEKDIEDKIRWRLVKEFRGNPVLTVCLAQIMKKYEKEITPADLLFLLRNREWFFKDAKLFTDEQREKYVVIAKELYESMEHLVPLQTLKLEEGYFLESAFTAIIQTISILNQQLEGIREITEAAQVRQGNELKQFIEMKRDMIKGFGHGRDFTGVDWYLEEYELELPRRIWYEIYAMTFELDETVETIGDALEKFFVDSKYSNWVTEQEKAICLKRLSEFKESLQNVITYICIWMLDSVRKTSLHEFREVLMYTVCFQTALMYTEHFSDMEIQKNIQLSVNQVRKVACDLRGAKIPIRIPKYFMQIGLKPRETFEIQNYGFQIKEPEEAVKLVPFIQNIFLELDTWSKRFDDILEMAATADFAEKVMVIRNVQDFISDLENCMNNPVYLRCNNSVRSMLRRAKINCAEYMSFVNSKYSYLSELRRSLKFLWDYLLRWNEKSAMSVSDLQMYIEQKCAWQGQERYYYSHILNYFLAHTGVELYYEIYEKIIGKFQSFARIAEEEWEQTSREVEQTLYADLDQMETQLSDMSEYLGEQEESVWDLVDHIMNKVDS